MPCSTQSTENSPAEDAPFFSIEKPDSFDIEAHEYRFGDGMLRLVAKSGNPEDNLEFRRCERTEEDGLTTVTFTDGDACATPAVIIQYEGLDFTSDQVLDFQGGINIDDVTPSASDGPCTCEAIEGTGAEIYCYENTCCSKCRC